MIEFYEISSDDNLTEKIINEEYIVRLKSVGVIFDEAVVRMRLICRRGAENALYNLAFRSFGERVGG